MKRILIVLIVALVASVFTGCHFAIVEDESIRVGSLSALAEGETVFDVEDPDLTPLRELEAAEAAEAARKAAAGETPEPLEPTPAPDDDEDAPKEKDKKDSDEETVIGLHSRDEEGESGVRRLQEALIEQGYLKIDADGVFGSKTLKALKRFQHDNGLKQTGMLDAETKDALFPKPEVTTAPDEVLYAEGATGEAIRSLQQRLRQYGFSARPANGEYDEETGNAVMDFQIYAVENYGTEFDDPVDVPELPSEPTLLVASDGTLSGAAPEGDEGETVAAEPTPEPTAEAALPEMPALAPVATLRPYHAVDDVVSENLYAYLIADRFPTYRRTVQRGDEGVEVERVQRRLVTLDYYYEEVNGKFDEATIEAVKVFQKRNGLQQTGIADMETQQKMFSEDAVGAEQVEKPFYIKVSLSEQRVYVYRWADNAYSQLIKTMICSSGLGNSTPKGVFVSPGHRDARWHYFAEFHCWAQYAFVIKGAILFHSVIYSRKDESSLRQSTVAHLGHKASHGCVRLRVEDAKWIYDHCDAGQVIEIY